MVAKENRKGIQDIAKVVAIRHSLGWTQKETADRSGYSERLVRKLELGGSVRPKTLLELLTTYHEALGTSDWQLESFLRDTDLAAPNLNRNEANERRIADYFETVFNQRQPHRVCEFVAENIKFTGEGRTARGRNVIEQRVKTLLDAFSPINHQIEDLFSRSDLVFCHWSVRQKHVGDFFGISATNKWVEARGNSICKLADNLVVEVEDQWDVDFVVRQLKGEDPLII